MSSYIKGVFSSSASSSYVPPAIGAAPAGTAGFVKKKKTTRLGFGTFAAKSSATETSSVAGSRIDDDIPEPVAVVDPPVPIETPETAHTPEVVPQMETEEKLLHETPIVQEVIAPESESVNVDYQQVTEDASHVDLEEDPVEDSDPIPEQPVAEDPIEPLLLSLSNILSSIKTLESRTAQLETKKSETETLISDVLSRQNQFCESEEFDKADELNVQIDDCRSQILAICRETFSEIPSQLVKLREEEKDLISKLSFLTESGLERIGEKKTESVEIFETLRSSLESRLEKITQVDVQFAQREEDIHGRKKLLEERQEEVDDLIAEESDSLEKERNEAEQEYNRLDELIADLQAQLAAAMAARSECAMTISGSELKLKNIRAKFSDVIEELETEKNQIDTEVGELLDEKIAAGGGDVLSVKEELENACISYDLEMENLNIQESDLVSRKSDLEQFFVALEKFDSVTNQEKLFISRSEYLDACELSGYRSESVLEIESEIAGFKTSLVSARETELPALEAAKKVAIANRAFRDAKEISDEMKRLTDEQAAANDKQTDLKSKLASARSDLQEARSIEDELREKLTNLESEFLVTCEQARDDFFHRIHLLRESKWCKNLVDILAPSSDLEQVSE
jgi:chromosome segregation ATPase